MADKEIVYLGRDNRFDLILKESGSAVDLSSVTHMAFVFSAVTISSVGRASWFDWTSGTTGEVRLSFGGATIGLGVHDGDLVVYDSSNTRGIHWGTVPILIKG